MMHVALLRFARFFTLFLCLFVLKAQSQSNVLIVAASTYTSDVQAKLNATGLFGKVDVFDANSGTPSVATLSGYQSVLVFSDEGFYNSTTLGNNLASYANAGGGVVTATFTFYPNSAYYVGGNFATTYQVIIPANGFTAGSTQTLGTIFYPNNPTIKGITNFNGGSSSYRNTSTSLTLGSYVVANWNDGLPLVVVKNNVGPANVNRVDLNFYPPSSDIRSDFWVSSTQGASLMAKALQYVSSAAAPTISSFTPTTASSGTTVTITGTNLTGATAVSFGGTAATSFSVVNSTTVTAVVGSGTSGNVSVTTPGGTTTLSGFTYCTNVTPSVSIAAVPSGAICSGTNVTFTATPTNGGSAPTYQWQKNGVTIATATASTFTYAPANGDVVSCTITANNTCQTTNTATSSITETVNPSPTAAVLSGTAAICNGSSSNLSVAITGGTSPFTVVYSGGTIPGYTSGSNISVSPSTTTSYSLNSVTDAKGCTVTSPTGTPTVTIKLPTTSTTTVAICSGSSYTFNGTTYTSAGTYVAHLTNAVGCDSAATLVLTVKVTSTSTTNLSICASSLPYSWNGYSLTSAGSYRVHLTNSVGCDSSATLVLTVKALSTSTTNASICSGGSYTFNGTNYTTAGTYVAHLTNSVGCDSAATLVLTVKSLSTSTTTAAICNGGSYTFNGTAYTNGGTYVAHLTNAVGCDSAATLVLTVKSLSTSTTTASICSGGSYTFNGTAYTNGGTYVAHITNAVGCDSAATLVLTVKPLSTSTTTAAICNGGSYTFNGTTYTSAGTYVAHLTNAVGCDSAATLVLTVKSLSTSTTNASICNGSSYTFNGTTYATAGTYVAHLTNNVGCDSAATLVLTVKSLSITTTTAAICSGSSYTFNGITYTTSGTYVAHLTNSVGCDSAATLVLTVKSVSISTTTAAICNGGSYTFNGTTYTSAGTYVAHLTNAVGCDSAATLVLTVKSLSTSTTTAAICNGGSYTFNGTAYTNGGTYVAHLTNAVGCDSAATLVLTVKSLSTSTTTAAICNGGSYTFNGTNYTTAGTYVAHLTNAVGCDSAATLVLTVKVTSTSTTNLSICASSLPYSWNGYSLTSAGSYRVHLTNSVGCDSSATLVLTVKALSTSTTNASICNGSFYTFNGTTYTTAGTYVAHLTNAVGCDSAATLVLTVKSLSTSTTTAAICSGSSYTFNGTTYTTAGTYVAHLTNAVSCDSAATLVLTVKSLSTSTTTAAICSGSSYTFNGITYTTAGTYVAHLTNSVGCDSSATLVLKIKSTSTSTTTASICNGGSYTFNGTTYTTAGTYVAHLTNAVGCDSAATLILTVKSLSTSKTTICICPSSSYTFNGVTYSTAGTYVAHLTNSVGCDSAATLVLKIKSTSTSTTTASICSGSSYTFNGTTYTTAGTYVAHLTNAVGCDSTATLILTVKSLSTSTTSAAICYGGSYTFNGTTYTTAGTYIAHLTNAVGCDSAATLVLTVNALPTTSISGTSSFCAGTNTLLTDNATAGSGNIACYKWYLNGTAIAGAKASTYTATTAGSYTVSVFNTNGCSVTSSAFAVAVNPLPTPTISGPTYGCGTVSYTASGGVSYLWNNGSTPTTATNTFITATSYGVSVTATNANGCTATATQTVPANTAPTISSVATQNTLVATSVSPTVTVGDLETPNSLTITACSNNTTLVPKANISVTGSGATRIITVTPAQNQIGTATIIVKVTDCGGLSTTTSFNVNVTVPNYPTGTANFAIVKTVSLIDNCSDSIYFVNESYNGAGATYQWYINGYYTTQPSFLNSTGGLIGYKTALPGTYTALLVVTDAAHQTTYQSSQTFTFTRGIVPVPSPSFTVGSVVANGSGTATVLLNSTTPYVQGGVINAWTVTPITNVAAFNTASSSPTLTITQTTAAQAFNATLTVTPTNGCRSYTTAVQQINVPAYSPIVPSFTVGVTKSKVDACNDSVFIVNNTTGGAGGNTYTWYFGDNSAAYVTTSTATIGRIYIHPNAYNILLVVTDKSGQTASKTVSVTTFGTVPPVTANAIIYGPYYTPAASTVTLDGGNSSTAYGGINYLWTLTPTGGSATTYTAANVPLTINRTSVNQNYTAVLTVKDALTGCRTSTSTQKFTVNALPAGTTYAVTTAELTEETKNIVSVYPNPARSTVNVKIMLANASDNVDIRVFNSMGKAVIESHQSTGNTKELTANMSVASLAAGLYYIKVYNQAGALIGSSTIVKQ